MAFYQSEKCFRRYEKVIAQALEKYPESVRFKSPTRTQVTDAARCTNAIAAYKRNRWTTAHSILDTIEDRPLSVWLEKDYCVIGPAIGKDAEIHVVSGPGGGMHGSVRCNPTKGEHVKQLVHLINDSVITQPIEIPRTWQDVAEAEAVGLLNIAIRIEATAIIIF